MTSATSRALSRLSADNPVPERRVAAFVPLPWREELLARILSEPIPPRSARRKRLRPRRRLVVLAAVLLAVLAAPAYAIGRGLIDGWLSGEPAPPSVVANFDSYAPQLGFRPDADDSVVVAKDGEISLYATTNDRGSYCVATGTPDGGTCVPPTTAAAPLVAGIMANDSPWTSRQLVVAGRVADSDARAIGFTDPDGNVVARPIGSSGFFVAALPVRGSPCRNGDWRPTFRAMGAKGEELLSATITLARQPRPSSGVCVWTPPHP